MDRTVHAIRSMLFVPASKPAMIEKAARSDADAVCLDLEDALVFEEKATGRANVVRALREVDFGHRLRIVRVNALGTPFTYRDVVDVVEGAGGRLDLVMIPKVGGPRDVEFVATLLGQIEAHTGLPRPIGIEAQIESAPGFLYAREIAASSPRLDALVFGPGDYSASMQMPASAIGEMDAHDAAYPGHRYHAVMHTIVAAARANGLRCMDGPYAGYKDGAGLEHACRIARVLGFDGKQCIHPAQLAAVNRAFTPSDDEIARAQGIVHAVEAAAAAGQGAASHEGRMIDAASLRMARATLERGVRTVEK